MKHCLVLAAAAATVTSFAQVPFTGTYSQNFDTLSNVGPANPWTDNATLGGWYATDTTYEADDGTSILSPAMKSYGSITGAGLPSTERALGSMIVVPGLFSSGVRLNNASGGTYTSLTVAYTGEQWRSSSSFTDLISFDYNPSATGLGGAGWVAVGALTFTSPNMTATGAIDGNLAANRQLLSATITGLNWLNGTDLWLRWTHSGFARHGMAIDDVHLQAGPVPEPFTAALAAAGLSLAARRRLGRGRSDV